MARVDPGDLLGRFDGSCLQIDDDRLLAATYDDALQRLVRHRVYLLMRNKWRDEDEIAGARFSYVFKLFAPAHTGAALYDIDHAFQLAVMMRPGLGIRMYGDGARPNLASPRARIVDRGGPDHAGCLGRVRIKPVPRHDFDSAVSPVGLIAFIRHEISGSLSVLPVNSRIGSRRV